jgi:hypothetical protein
MQALVLQVYLLYVGLGYLQFCQCNSSFLTSLSLGSIGISNSLPAHRFLEDQQGGDFDEFTVTQGNCFRMKIENNNDDDGNAYFYNGAYRSQYERYISYLMCNNYGSGICREYVMGLNDYLEQTVPFVQNWCNSCAASCRRLRLLQEDEQMTVDCSACVNDCKLLNNNKESSGVDESNYIGCLEAANDENGMNYFTAPQCESDHIVIGRFYDDECTIKTTTISDGGFSYNTFATIERMSLSCKADNSETCNELYANAIAICENGVATDADDQNAVNICKASAAARRVYQYYKKPFFKKIPITLICILLFGITFILGFLSYTYYVRHRRSAMIPMAALDGETTEHDPKTGKPLPAIS